MIAVEEAKNIIRNKTMVLSPVKKPLKEAAGLILASDVYAVTDIPAFEQSSMDGYAVRFGDLHSALRLKGEMAAGVSKQHTLKQGEATRIFTGAPLPSGADTVIMQEKVMVQQDTVIVSDATITKGHHVRAKGSEIKAGMPAMNAGSLLSPAAIGFLAGIGVDEVMVYPSPSVAIIITGNELQQPGNPLLFGQVYDANSFQLSAALQQIHLNDISVLKVGDDLVQIQQVLQQALEQSDMVLLTGGVSVGDYDFVLQAATACGVSTLFHKIKQRPGKPLFFGLKENKPVFGLPGNPSSVLTCFYEYVIPAIEKLTGKMAIVKSINVPLAKSFQKAAGLTHFLKGFFDGHKVMPLDAQESYRLSSFAKANCLVKIEEEVGSCEEGQLVEIHLLPV